MVANIFSFQWQRTMNRNDVNEPCSMLIAPIQILLMNIRRYNVISKCLISLKMMLLFFLFACECGRTYDVAINSSEFHQDYNLGIFHS